MNHWHSFGAGHHTERLKVFGGWLVRTCYGFSERDYAMAFVPDAQHAWEAK